MVRLFQFSTLLYCYKTFAMKKLIFLFVLFAVSKLISAQEKQQIDRACLNYLEGFYEGDTTKLIAALKPSLFKYGYWKNKNTGNYDPDGQMTYREALDYANNVQAKKSFAKADAPKKVEVLDMMNTIASAKVTAWWGVDYILLAKQNGKWMIEQVLWEGPLVK
jgi:hypothetical protein